MYKNIKDHKKRGETSKLMSKIGEAASFKIKSFQQFSEN